MFKAPGTPPQNDEGAKPSHLSHVPDEHLSAYTKHAGSENRMSHVNLMACKGGMKNGQ